MQQQHQNSLQKKKDLFFSVLYLFFSKIKTNKTNSNFKTSKTNKTKRNQDMEILSWSKRRVSGSSAASNDFRVTGAPWRRKRMMAEERVLLMAMYNGDSSSWFSRAGLAPSRKRTVRMGMKQSPMTQAWRGVLPAPEGKSMPQEATSLVRMEAKKGFMSEEFWD